MRAFIEKNQTNKIVFGERRTSENKPVFNYSDLKNSDRILYRFDDGYKITLTKDDSKSAPNFKPEWALA